MRLRLNLYLLFVILCVSISTATDYYYNQSGGNDANDCSTPALACKTISDMNGKALVGGDRILFARGERWRILDDAYSDNDALPVLKNGSGTAPITYTAYGTGPKPEFWGSLNFSNTSMWINIGSNLWKTYYNIVPDVGNLILNNETDTGIRVQHNTSVTSQGKWHYNETTNNLTFYSISNPASYYYSIEISAKPATQEMLWNFDHKANIVLSNLSMRYTGVGFLNGENMKNISWLDNDLRFGGGDWQGTTRYGNCMDIQMNATNIIIAGNNVSECYDGALTIEQYLSGGRADVSNILVHHNIFSYSAYPIEYFSSNTANTASNITFHHNTLAFSGSQWAYEERYGTGHITYSMNRFSRTPLATTGFNFSENIIFTTKDYALHMGSSAGYWPAQFHMDRNLWYSKAPNLNITFNATNYKNYSLFRTANPTEDVNGINTNPLFVDENGYDFRPISTSPACTLDANGGYVGALPCQDEEDIISNISISGDCNSSCVISTPYYNVTLLEGTVYGLYSNWTGNSYNWTYSQGASQTESLGQIYVSLQEMEPTLTTTNCTGISVGTDSVNITFLSQYGARNNWSFKPTYFEVDQTAISGGFYSGNYLHRNLSVNLNLTFWNGTQNFTGASSLTAAYSYTGAVAGTFADAPDYLLAISFDNTLTNSTDYRNIYSGPPTIGIGRGSRIIAGQWLNVKYKVLPINTSQAGTEQVLQPLRAFKSNPLYGDLIETEEPEEPIINYNMSIPFFTDFEPGMNESIWRTGYSLTNNCSGTVGAPDHFMEWALEEQSAGYYKSSNRTFRTFDANAHSHYWLQTPAFTLNGSPANVSFWFRARAENNYDGMVIEYQINESGAWAEVHNESATVFFSQNPYTTYNGYGGTGTSGTSCRTKLFNNDKSNIINISIPSVAGNISFRFVGISDTNTDYADPDGFWIDDFNITYSPLGEPEPPAPPAIVYPTTIFADRALFIRSGVMWI